MSGNLKRITFILRFFISLSLCSCGSSAVVGHRSNQISGIRTDLVTVETALNLSRSAYIRGCTEELHAQGKKYIYFDCLKKAELFINEVESILAQ